jgi:hypothetical protein
MSENISIPNEQDLQSIRSNLDEAKRLQEYKKLKAELSEVLKDTLHAQAGDEDAMQAFDTEKLLHTKRKSPVFIEQILSRLRNMFSPKPIMGNIIALGLVIFSKAMLNNQLILQGFGKYQQYIGIGLLTVGALQIIKSGARSLLLPVGAIFIGAIVSHQLAEGQTLFTYGADFYQYLMIAGIVGVGVSVLTIS